MDNSLGAWFFYVVGFAILLGEIDPVKEEREKEGKSPFYFSHRAIIGLGLSRPITSARLDSTWESKPGLRASLLSLHL